MNNTQRIKLDLERRLNTLETHYKISKKQHKMLADISYKFTINDKNIIQILSKAQNATKEERAVLRKQLSNILKVQFERMKIKGMKIFQFVLPDNTSFLRMHKQDKYGDNIADIRYSFKYVNETKKPIDGFEQGKISHAFRYVYPIFNKKDIYLGSVELSYKSDYFEDSLYEINNINTHFLVDKKIFDANIWDRDSVKSNYTQSAEHEDYALSIGKRQTKEKCIINNYDKLKDIKDQIYIKIKEGEKFAIYNYYNNHVNTFSFYPVKNIKEKKTVAWFVTYENSEFIKTTINGGIIIRIISFLVSIILFYFIYKVLHQKEMLNEINLSLEEKVHEQTLSLYTRLYYDDLTGLPKRNKFMEDLQMHEKSNILFINIQEFKNVNSVYGNSIGDIVLKRFAEILKKIAYAKNCNLYRFSGDEFVLLNTKKEVRNVDAIQTAIDIISDVEENAIVLELEKETIDIYLKIVMGISIGEDEPLKSANYALSYAKQKRLPYAIYSKELNLYERVKDNMKWTKIIKKAIKNDKVVPFFQPIKLKNGKVKYESLIRIIDNDKVISPYFFLEIAKKAGYYTALTKIMIEKSFKAFEHREENFSINFSFEDISNNATIYFLIEKIKQYKIQNRLIIEILESESIDDFEILQVFISTMKKLGVKIAIDDFGSGYSNFHYLLKMEPDFIKIDGSIIKNIDKNEGSYKITQTIVEFANKLGTETIAEYIHSKEVYEKTKELGVDAFQGFYLGEPSSEIKAPV
ncbi:MAG: EAL domain-containing protein [Arcobacteraceae bacterium]|nr:EAL domain-containing protein [Arcobacteraceae bacterium]